MRDPVYGTSRDGQGQTLMLDARWAMARRGTKVRDPDGSSRLPRYVKIYPATHLGFAYFPVGSYTFKKKEKRTHPRSATLPLSVCFCICETEAVIGFKGMVCPQAVHKPR